MVSRKKQRIDDLAASTARRSAGPGDPEGGATPARASSGGAAGTVLVADAGKVTGEGLSLWASAWRRLRRSPIFLTGATIVFLFLVLAAIAPWLAPHDPAATDLLSQINQQSNPVPAAQPGYPLGGDPQGRDLLSRLIVGSQQTLIVGVLATLGGLAGGLTLGLLAGGIGGWVDTAVMRLVDVMLSFPSLLLAFTIAALFQRPSQASVIVAIAIIQIPVFARLLRGSMLAQRHSDHVLAARALGVRRAPIVFRHMLPNAISPVIVQATIVLATAIIDAAALSFLGLGNPDDRIPEWGQMLGASQRLFDSHPQLAFLPALCIVVVALGFTLMGESMREALDPRSRR